MIQFFYRSWLALLIGIFAILQMAFVFPPYSGNKSNIYFTSPNNNPQTNSCGITVKAGPDITICKGTGKQLNGMVSGGSGTTYTWEPPDGLSDPNILNPVANPAMTTTYKLTARAMGNNLVVNGDFETGVINPATTTYTLAPDLTTFVNNGNNRYIILSYPQISSQFGCTTKGNQSMVIHGSTGGTCWCQNIPVTPNTDYKIGYSVMSTANIFFTPVVNMTINGKTVLSISTSGICSWTDDSGIWNSGSSTNALVCLTNVTNGGMFNMCAVDDIFMKECCVETDDVNVEVYDVVAQIEPSDEINCRNSPLTLDASQSTNGTGVSYEWKTTDGNIVSGGNTLKPKIDKPGTYTLTVKGLYGCEAKTSITINGNVEPPDLTLKKKDIFCLSKGTIEASSSAPGVSYEWMGPNGYFSSRSFDNGIVDAGDYNITITDSYGCQTKGKITVDDKKSTVDVNIKGDTITCDKDSIILNAYTLAKKPDFTWTGPNKQKSDTSSIIVKDTGWFTILIRDSIGCINYDSFYVFNFKTKLPVKINADTINCFNNQSILKIQTDTTGTVSWKGPNGFTSNLFSPLVNEPGWYFVDVITKSGCRAKDSILVIQSNDVPELHLGKLDTLTCFNQSVSIIGNSNTPGTKISWIGPNGFIGSDSLINVIDSGNYVLIAQGSNGCLVSKPFSITKNTNPPDVVFLNDSVLNCINTEIQVNLTKSQAISFDWVGPNGFISNLPNPILKDVGEYILNVRGANGCTQTKSLIVKEDKTLPVITVFQQDSITCIKNFILPNINVDTTGIQFNWLGPNGFNSNLLKPQITQSGRYQFDVTGKNGCVASVKIDVIENKNKPTGALLADTIRCNTIANIEVIPNDPNDMILWKGPNNFISSLAKNAITISGWYTLTLTGNNGCQFIDSIFVVQKDQLPDIMAFDDSLTCARPFIFINAGSNTVGAKYEWTGPNGFTSNVARPLVRDSGMYTLKVIDPNGCEAIKSIIIRKFGSIPDFQLRLTDTAITCKNNNVQIELLTPEPEKSILWSGPNNFTANGKTILVSQSGWYYINFVNIFDCNKFDSVFIQDLRKVPQASVQDAEINCKIKNITLDVISTENNLKFQWTGPNNFSSANKNPAVSIPGDYRVEITNEFDCKLNLVLKLSIDTVSPDLTLEADSLTCSKNTATIKANSNTKNIIWQWTGPNNFSSAQEQFNTSIPGFYICTIMDPQNGCSITKSIQLIEDTNRIQKTNIISTDETCDKNNASICVCGITGGKEPYQYSFDGGKIFSDVMLSTQLNEGTYDIVVKDQNNCLFTDKITIINSPGVKANIVPKIELNVNESTNLDLLIDKPSSEIKSINWSPSDQLSCSDCTNPVLTAQHNDIITIVVTDINDCTSKITLEVVVKTEEGKGDIFIPFVFSPNGDGLNDVVYPQGEIDIPIAVFQIYNRWGEQVYHAEQFKSNDFKMGWNGEYRGKKLNPGVYVYVLNYTLNNVPKSKFGEITLIR